MAKALYKNRSALARITQRIPYMRGNTILSQINIDRSGLLNEFEGNDRDSLK